MALRACSARVLRAHVPAWRWTCALSLGSPGMQGLELFWGKRLMLKKASSLLRVAPSFGFVKVQGRGGGGQASCPCVPCPKMPHSVPLWGCGTEDGSVGRRRSPVRDGGMGGVEAGPG